MKPWFMKWTIRAVLMAPNGGNNTKNLGNRLILYDNKVFVQSKDIARNFSGSVHEYNVSFSKRTTTTITSKTPTKQTTTIISSKTSTNPTKVLPTTSFKRTENNILAWYVILIIVLVSLLILVAPLLLVIWYKKKRTNNTVDVQ